VSQRQAPPMYPKTLELVAGDDFRFGFRLTNRNRDLLTWTGYGVTAQILSKAAFGQPVSLLYQSSNILNSADGEVSFNLARAVTGALTWTRGTLVFIRTTPSGEQNVILRAAIEVKNRGGA
jgi:hypothetical protein